MAAIAADLSCGVFAEPENIARTDAVALEERPIVSHQARVAMHRTRRLRRLSRRRDRTGPFRGKLRDGPLAPARRAMTLDHGTIPNGHKTARVRGWRVTLLRRLAKSKRTFSAQDLARFVNRISPEAMTMAQARAMCASYVRKGELRQIKKGIGGQDSVEGIYSLDGGAEIADR